MADNSDARESDNNSWVMAGSEALPVEDLGSEAAAESQPEAPLPTESQQAPVDEKEAPQVRFEPEEPKPKPLASAVAQDLPSGETPGTSEPPLEPPPPPHAKDSLAHHAEEGAAAAASPPGVPVVHTAGAGSAAEDVEGLRRRKKDRDGAVGAVGGPPPRDRGPRGEEGGQAFWLCGFLALLGLGLLVALGVVLDNGDDGLGDALTAVTPGSGHSSLYTASGGSGSEGKDRLPPEPPTGEAGLPPAGEEGAAPRGGGAGDPLGLEAMGALLDKMAKENQDIRLMQAELQAQKEELQALLRKTEGEAQASGGQQRSLEAENARLREALRREAASLQAARDELRLLRGAGGTELGPQPRPEPPETEARRLRSALESIGRDLSEGGPRSEPGALRRKVGQALGRGPEGPRPKRGKGPEERKPRKPPPPPGKGRKPKRKPREPSALWQALSARRFPAPRGCSGVPECARKEGLAPVPRAAFLQAVRGALSGRGWGRQAAEGLEGATGGFFSPHDGLFAHDRLSLVALLDAAEDALEELAEGLGGSEEEADDFEEEVLRHLGRVTPGKDRGRRNGRENSSRAFGHP